MNTYNRISRGRHIAIARSWFCLPALAGLVLISGCAATETLQSTRSTGTMFVDGELTEWSGSLREVPHQPLRMGVRHDDEFVYISLQTIDEAMLRRVMLGGLTVWLNPEGDKSREIGIRYPIGLASTGALRIDPNYPPTARQTEASPLSELELTDAAGHAARWPVTGVPGLEVKSYLEYGSFTYELKVPIEPGPDKQLGISPGPDGIFGIGIEAGAVGMNDAALTSPSQTTEAPAGRGRRGGGGTSRQATPTGASGLESVVFWTKISLGNGSAETP